MIFSYLEKLNGKFKSINRWRRSESVTEKEYDDGWYVGETTKRNFRLCRLEACLSGLIAFVQERTRNILQFEWRQICWRMEQRHAGWKRDLLLYQWRQVRTSGESFRMYLISFTDLKDSSRQGTLRVRESFSLALLTSTRGTFLQDGKS